MRFAYQILFAIFFCLSAPYYFLKMWRRGNWQAGFAQRFGCYNEEFKNAVSKKPALWFHAVSVGEVNLCLQLIRVLEPRLPDFQIIVSTTTSTGMGELQKKLPTHIQKIFYPIDFFPIVRRALKTIQPRAIILVEAELWPNFLWQSIDRHIPLFLVNARVSEKSFRGYKRARFLFGPIFAKFRAVGCQDETDAVRLRELGFAPPSVRVVGNLKFDVAQSAAGRALDVRALLRQLGVRDDARLLVAGSTHAGEEAILGEIFLRLRKKFPDLFFVLVPRHFERAKEVARALETCGVKFFLRSEMNSATQHSPGEVECLLVNTTGELKFFYEHAAVVFVGKSLTARGGQNPIEPGALGKALVFGPNMQNFTSVTEAFLARKGAVRVRDSAGLETALDALLSDDARRNELGKNAATVVRENQGATERTAQLLAQHLTAEAIAPSARGL